MKEKRLDELIVDIVNSVANNNPAPLECKIIKDYNNGFADVQIENYGELTYVKVIGDTAVDTEGIVCFVDGSNPIGITDIKKLLEGKQDILVSGENIKTINNTSILGSGNINIEGGGTAVIGTGSFTINSSGHLIVELPNAVDNPYFINTNGHLVYDTTNTYNGD